ncbi:aminotransferase class V-fold PLP-dependent enzyme [Pseudobutyrivibrio xylanivorans]|uniref:Cysteine desulfurase family protein n=1 Tax=Pseudobutyrivibrio xylanivorans DSM 14809 TaxID=1123012 RepID=A0A1M6JVV1_PSEXY|nr:aminotransferase class V-fold PLP-dependent enzyme [Pseudobutyrivibrio xylanivorans]SHJ50782.1 cysteine desulfurase family protein [Pseudobutyrivibrio xylanivorans DSM 14809]
MIYLDNAATTFPKPEEVYQAMDKANRELSINAGRGSYRLAREASKLISDTKQQLRDIVYADISASVVFAPSITIALNQVIQGLELNRGDVVYVSPYEHNAVARTIHLVEKQKGIVIKFLPLNEQTLEVDLDRMRYEFAKDKPRAVICIHVSNVTGYILPVKEIFEAAKEYEAITVLDTAQSLGLIPVDSKSIDADIISFAGHKTLYGPFGIGGFINVTGISLNECIVGGTGSDSLNLDMPAGSEAKYESASKNIVAIAGLNAALKKIDQSMLLKKEQELTDYLIKGLEKLDGIKLYLPTSSEKHVGIVSFNLEGYSAEDLGTILDEDFDIAVRTGYHCAPWIHEYLKDSSSLGTVRIGLGQFNNISDIDNLINALEDL